MELVEHADKPELTIRSGGKEYNCGAIWQKERAELDAWLMKRVPHPLDAIKNHLEGLPASVVTDLTRAARQDAKHWPPQVGTAEGTEALLSTPGGQIEMLRVALQKFHSGATEVDAERLFHAMNQESFYLKRQAKLEGRADDSALPAIRILCTLRWAWATPRRELTDPKANGEPAKIAATAGGSRTTSSTVAASAN